MNSTRSLMGLSALAGVALLVVSGCFYDSAEKLYPDNLSTCDTATVTYSGTIAKIMSNNCNGCHSASAPSGNVNTSTHAALSAYIDNKKGTFYRSMTQDSTISAMPKGGSKLSDCDLRKIKKWLDAGKPNN